MILIICYMVVNSQSLKELKVGDTVPPLNVQVLSGNETKTVSLSSFYKKKYLIIDFWATWCGACIRAIFKGDSVKAKFRDKLNLLPITYQDNQTISSFLDQSPKLRGLNLEYVVGDSVLMGGYFKFTILPHQVWIDTSGVVRAISYPDELTFENIKTFIEGGEPGVEEKMDIVEFDLSKPLPTNDSLFLYRSVLTPYKNGLLNVIGTFNEAYNKNTRIQRFLAINKDLLSIFYAIYSRNQGNISMSRVELDIRDSMALSPFLVDSFPERKNIRNNSYCYELILPEKLPKSVFYSRLLTEVNNLFPFTASIERRNRECWVIVNRNSNLNPKKGKGSPGILYQAGFIRTICNQTMDVLTEYLDKEMDSIPVVDETNFLSSFDLDIDVQIKEGSRYFDIEKIRSSLQGYGFDLIRSERMIDILVIREKKGQKT